MASTNEPLKISEIRRDGGTQMRVSLDEATIERYAEDMRNNRWEWGPHNWLVVVHDDKSERPEGVYWLADGFHRIEAAQRAGWASVKCRVEEGGRRDAVLLAAGANASHGLSRSRDDVQRAIRALLLDAEWRKWSNRAIAEKVRCDHKTVGALRDKLIASGEIPHEEERVYSRNGTTHTQAAPAKPVPILRITDHELFEKIKNSSNLMSIGKGKISNLFTYDGRTWIPMSSIFPGQRDCVAIVPVGTSYPPGEKNPTLIDGAYTGKRAVNRGQEYELTGQWLFVQDAPPTPPARPAGAPSLAEYEAAVKSLASCGYKLTCGGIQRGLPPYWIVDPKGDPKRFSTWAEAEARMEEIATETPLDETVDYEAMIALANNAPALTQLRLTIAADKMIGNERNDVLQLAINQRFVQLESPAAQPAGESMAAELERVADPKAAPDWQRITIQTSDGPTKVIPIFKTEHIALAPFAGSYSITHLETGAKIGPEIKDRHLAEQRFSLLADLDWSAGITDELRLRARKICGLSNEPEDIRFSQLQTRATACGCSIVTYHNRRGLLRKGQEIVSTGSLDLDHLENIIADVEGADRIAALSARAATLGYSFTPHGGSWRISRGETPMGAVRDLDELERSIVSWEQAQERAQQAEEPAAEPEQAEEPAAEPEQAEEPAAEPEQAEEPRSPTYDHVAAIFSGLIERANEQELRLLFLLTYSKLPSDFGIEDGELDLREEVWQGGQIVLENALSSQMSWVLGEAVAQ